MINEFSTSPKPQNKNAHIACAVAMAAFAALTAAYMLMDKYRGVVGLAAITALTAGIYIYTKYMSAKYHYDITNSTEGQALLVVRRSVGKRDTTLYMTPLYRIQAVEMQTRGAAKKHDPAFARHYFTPTFMPLTTCLITVKSRLESAELVIECSEDFANILSRYAAEERDREALEEENY